MCLGLINFLLSSRHALLDNFKSSLQRVSIAAANLTGAPADSLPLPHFPLKRRPTLPTGKLIPALAD